MLACTRHGHHMNKSNSILEQGTKVGSDACTRQSVAMWAQVWSALCVSRISNSRLRGDGHVSTLFTCVAWQTLQTHRFRAQYADAHGATLIAIGSRNCSMLVASFARPLRRNHRQLQWSLGSRSLLGRSLFCAARKFEPSLAYDQALRNSSQTIATSARLG